ncbi:glycoside hydrolase family 76 protein [Trematosphaeria pertusa]|uniref:Glycoside hydrolase family 76 protein n=1 Tax=Trematosphaeria pertusa TaxID=390896 RepID=A0A6A6J3J3_9PLEO|nr:glycoside hydrolase family 76 protein [Trematosphaeria pertusa]KAF2257138.1 glycoside hydrolase family 76 protein [Trematosphaeria pertusa]
MKYSSALFFSLLYVSPAVADFADNANAAIKTLQDKWYSADTGLWNDYWWQSGNIVEALARFGQHDASFKQTATDIIANTYAKSPNQKGYSNWKNDYYDDMGWWALGWIAAYDLTSDAKYLNSAKDLFEDMTGGWTTPCNGGIWWNKEKTSIAAIANELFLSTAAHLANRVGGDEKADYVHWAQMEWDWFWTKGFINGDNVINDGIDISTCTNNGQTTFTYNQGVILGGLSELARATGDGGYIDHANQIANGALTHLTDNGILTEPVSGPLDDQGSQFKGAFVRGLAVLNGNEPQQSFTDFLKKNADSAWTNAKNSEGVIEDRWQGGSDNTNAATQASGIDVLVAAAQAS